MNPELLSQLNDILLPEPVGWWPLASSVWFILVGWLGILIGLSWYFWQRHKKSVYRRHAIQQLKQLGNERSASEWLTHYNALLKQVAITTYGRNACAGLTDQAWLKFLHQKAAFIEQPPALEKLARRYQPQVELSEPDKAALQYFAQRWIKEHHL